jgi:oxygen-independent coproporphyrinogen-3 oxidase
VAAGIYIHIPFCKSRCSYCDFATEVYREGGGVESYVRTLCREIDNFPHYAIEANTVYFGGGTPSLLSPDQVERILASVHQKFAISAAPEITMEMNPATVTPDDLSGYRGLGVNRASFGVQTFDDRELKLLSRGHDADDVRTTFQMLRQAGFENVSFDLIAGLPGQTIDLWRRNLAKAIALSPEHLSLYLLEIHEGTPLAEQVRSGRRPVPDEDLAAVMYEIMIDSLASAGYQQYEISNFSRAGFRSKHNTKYWRLEPVYGFGVSAHSFDLRERYANERDTARYVELITKAESAEVMREEVDVASEFVFLGLRLEDGIDLTDYERRFGSKLSDTHSGAIDELVDKALVELVDDRMRLTRRGKLFSNEVFAMFV